MTPTGTLLLSWGGCLTLAMNQSTCYSCLRGRKVDRLRDVRRLDALGPRQVRDRPRQLQHAMIRPRAQVHLPHGRAQELRPVSSTGQ